VVAVVAVQEVLPTDQREPRPLEDQEEPETLDLVRVLVDKVEETEQACREAAVFKPVAVVAVDGTNLFRQAEAEEETDG
jgi:hypothetical protein